MMPPAKKQKTGDAKDESMSKPIILHCPGHYPDTRIMVFDQEYHAHSMLLKLNSAFFRKFMDSPDKEMVGKAGDDSVLRSMSARSSLAAMSNFQYEWVTKVDEEGEDWSLVAKDPKNEPYSLETFTGDETEEINTFEKLLRAMHLESYTLDSTDELSKMTKHADYLAALPLLSRSLDGALIDSPSLCLDMYDNSTTLFELAAKLRNALLFRESLVYMMWPFSNVNFNYLGDSKLRKILKNARNEIAAKVAAATSMAIVVGAGSFDNDDWDDGLSLQKDLFKDVKEQLNECMEMESPQWFRGLLDTSIGKNYRLRRHLHSLLQSNLVLDRRSCVAGVDPCERDFLCATIADEDLPWDVDEKDW